MGVNTHDVELRARDDELAEVHEENMRLVDSLAELRAQLRDSVMRAGRGTDWHKWIEDPPPAGECVLVCQKDDGEPGYAYTLGERMEDLLLPWVDAGSFHDRFGDPRLYPTFWRFLPAAPPEFQLSLFDGL